MFAQQTMHMSDGAAHFLLSLYSIGSITGVLVLFALLGRNVKESRLLLIVNAIALAALLVIMQSGQTLLRLLHLHSASARPVESCRPA